MSAVNLTLGDSSGTPPTGNIVKLYAAWNGGIQIGEYPTDVNYKKGGNVKIMKALDGLGAIQQPTVDSREWYIRWAEIDMDVFDIPGSFVHELRARRFLISNSYYYLGANDISGAYYFDINPIRIRIIDVISTPVPNSENKKLENVEMIFQIVQ